MKIKGKKTQIQAMYHRKDSRTTYKQLPDSNKYSIDKEIYSHSLTEYSRAYILIG